MMLRRVWPRPTRPSGETQNPCPSGPRWCRAWAARSSAARAIGSRRENIATMPHMSAAGPRLELPEPVLGEDHLGLALGRDAANHQEAAVVRRHVVERIAPAEVVGAGREHDTPLPDGKRRAGAHLDAGHLLAAVEVE